MEELLQNLEKRQALLRSDRNVHTHWLSGLSAEELLSLALPYVVSQAPRFCTVTSLSKSIGTRLMMRHRREPSPVEAIHVGWFILIAFIENGILGYKLKHQYKKNQKSKHQSYQVTVKLPELLLSLWETSGEDADLFPLGAAPGPWLSARHPLGFPIVKRSTPELLNQITPESNPLVYSALNRLASQPWVVDWDMLELAEYLFNNQDVESPLRLENERDEERKASKRLSTQATLRVARKFEGQEFYHLYNLDFRGRIYCNTSFLHEQSTDLAKGLLRFRDPEPLGSEGLYWLYVHTANSWGEDKLTLDDRAEFVEERLSDFLRYAENPLRNTEWMAADKPWSFLAACQEIDRISRWEGPVEDFPCSLPVFIDGTVSGIQHLVAMSRDETMAPHVNLLPSEAPGDLYNFVAGLVWARIDRMVSETPPEVVGRFEEVFETAVRMQREYEDAPRGSDLKNSLYSELQTWRNNNRQLREQLMPVFWSRITDTKLRRKIVKRIVMTVGYGVTRYGAGQQIVEDTIDLSEDLRNQERLWAVMMGSLIYDTCREELGGPARLLQLFETLAARANERGEYLSWTVPATNFPVVQSYRQPVTQRTKLKIGRHELKIRFENWAEATLKESSQISGASPNMVHSLDAAHMTMVVASVDYDIAVIHDSFGCLPGRMDHLFSLVREKFTELYEQNPLQQILEQLNATDLMPDLGSLDLSEVTKSDFAFS